MPVGTVLQNSALLQHHDIICPAENRQAVRNDENSAVVRDLLEVPADALSATKRECCRKLLTPLLITDAAAVQLQVLVTER